MVRLNPVYGLRTNWRKFKSLAPHIGFRAAAEYVIQTWLGSRGSAVFSLHPNGVRHALRVRRGSSDIRVFRQIFIDREYSCVDDPTANIPASMIWSV
jgi:hypothetical protein